MDDYESILLSIRKMVGLEKDDDSFDADIIFHTNTALSILTQVGVGPKDGFTITGENETWKDFLGENFLEQQMVVSYIQLKVRLLFDPPNSSFVLESYKESIRELEWRLNISAD